MEPTKKISRLDKVLKGKLTCAWRYSFYGAEGVGKTSLAADAPNPIFLDMDGGSACLGVDRYLFRDEVGGHVPASYEDVLAAIEDLTENPHEYKTIVIDTLDTLEPLLWGYVVKHESGRTSALNKGGVKFDSILELGYGNGYALAVEEWRRLAIRLDVLRNKRGMAIVLLAHEQIKTFKSPDSEDYDRRTQRLNDKAAGFIREWADVNGFVCFEDGSGKLKGGDGRVKGFSTGRRLIKLNRTATYDAKTRLALTDQIELEAAHPWRALEAAVLDSDAITLATLEEKITSQCKRINDPEISARVKVATAKAVAEGNKGALSRILRQLEKTDAKSTETATETKA
jgi:hypothetical protein